MTSALASWILPCFPSDLGYKSGLKGGTKCILSGEELRTVYSSRASLNNAPVVKGNEKYGSGAENEDFGSIVGGKRSRRLGHVKLEGLWDDGYGTASLNDYLDVSRIMIKPDGGPPRWFCPIECGCPLEGSPVLLSLSGMDGVGFGLMMHHKALGKVFEVRCLHIPVYDRTPFKEGGKHGLKGDGESDDSSPVSKDEMHADNNKDNRLVQFVEKSVKEEHASSPNKPIYLVGDSFGGCLALAVAARCPSIDLVLILANPATSLNRSSLKPFFPILEALPDKLHNKLPHLLSFVMGETLKMAMVNIDTKLPPGQMLQQMTEKLISLWPRLSVVADIIPKETLVWKLKLLKSGVDYTNRRLHDVKAEVLVLASGKDSLLPSVDEAKRLSGLMKNCEFRTFKENGHTLLMEDGVNLLTVIKATGKYRRSRRLDVVIDFVPPSLQECKVGFNKISRRMQYFTSPVILSTLRDGKIVRGLNGVPSEGPVLLVGYHMLMGFELAGLYDAFFSEKKITLRGLAHPQLLTLKYTNEMSYVDYARVFGATPVTAKNFFKLLSTKSHILLYPGGAREALHLKGEEYKVIWPDQPEFVRMAANFGATIVPFGVVGEDDVVKLIFDYNDYMRIPGVNYVVQQFSNQLTKVRNGTEGEVGNEMLYVPGTIPKLPGRFYYLFGKPIETQGKPELVKDKESARELYAQIKSEVESGIAYLLHKRNEDPYRSFIDRAIFKSITNGKLEVPTFSP